MFVYVWEYRVREGAEEAFLDHYAPTGSWAKLFARGAGYVGTNLLRDRDDRARFLTVDTWQSAAHLAAFKTAFGEEFDELDLRCEELTDSERHLGDFRGV